MINCRLKTALITGASSGIGRQFALTLAKEGCWNLILVARNEARLMQVKEEVHQFLPGKTGQLRPMIDIEIVDLTSQEERSLLFDRLEAKNVTIDLLINNAGFARLESFDTSDCGVNQQLIDVHCAAPVHLCRAILPSMLKRNSGQIINVCSMVASSPMPFVACYAASKAFLLYFSLALAGELKSTPIKVLALCPGSTDTPGHSTHTSANSRNLLGIMTSEQVVVCALRALAKPSNIYIVGFKNRLLFRMLHTMPIVWATRIQGMRTKAVLKSRDKVNNGSAVRMF